MKNTLITISSISMFLLASIGFGQHTVRPEMLENIMGEWEGALTYLDYQTNEPFTMPVNLNIENGKNEYLFKLFLEYPKEPKANGTDKIRLSKDGTRINKATIISTRELTEEEFEIITEYSGKDNNKKAQIRVTYIIKRTELIIRKEVKFKNSEEWILRSEYNYNR